MKSMIAVATLMVLMLVLTGCPMPEPIPLPDDPIPAGMGRVMVEGDLLSGEKSWVDFNDIVELFKPRIARMEFSFYPPIDIGKGGGGFGQVFSIEVVDGLYSGSFLLEQGDYDVYIVAYDYCGNQLFYDDSSIQVIAGETATLEVVFGLTSYYNFQFAISDLPGDYGDYGEARVVSNGEIFYASYYRHWLNESQSFLVFSAYLPISFTGYLDRSAVIVRDMSGQEQASTIAFDIFDTAPCQFLELSYLPVDWLGEVDIDIDFEVY